MEGKFYKETEDCQIYIPYIDIVSHILQTNMLKMIVHNPAELLISKGMPLEFDY